MAETFGIGKDIYDFFKWSENQYELRKFITKLGEYQPFVILITEGYLGRDEQINSEASGNVYWCHDIIKQPRLVVTDSQDQWFSIPYNLEDEVIPMIKPDVVSGDPPMKIKELRKASKYKYFKFKDRKKCEVYSGPEAGRICILECLQIKDDYQERFLVVHCMVTDETKMAPCWPYCQFALIPIYMPINVAVALALEGGSQTAFYETMLDYKKFVDACDHDYTNILQKVSEIMVFDSAPTSGDYEAIHWLKLAQENRPEISVSGNSSYMTILKVPNSPSSSKIKGTFNKANKKATLTKKLRDILSSTHKKKVPKRPPLSMLRAHASLNKERPPTPTQLYDEELEDETEVMTKDKNISEVNDKKDVHCSRTEPIAHGMDPKVVLSQLKDILTTHITTSKEVSADYQGDSTTQFGPSNNMDSLSKDKHTNPASSSPEAYINFAENPDCAKTGNAQNEQRIALNKAKSDGLVYEICDMKINNTENNLDDLPPPAPPPKPRAQILRAISMDDSSRQPMQTSSSTGSRVDIPMDISKLSASQLADWLHKLRLSEYAEKFKVLQINGSMLASKDEKDLVNEFGFRIQDAKRLVQFLQK